ncbi:hypothetical protein EJB05_25598, partial [Eragrostis curvula]
LRLPGSTLIGNKDESFKPPRRWSRGGVCAALAGAHRRALLHQSSCTSAISDVASSPSSSSSELLQLFCFKKPPALASTFTVHDPHAAGDDEETVEAQLMRLGNLVGPPRLLFTIKEETKEDLESEDGRSRSLADLLHCPGTPFLTPASSPAPPSVAAADNSYNPLFESPMASPGPAPPAVSPPPKFQFLKDAEEKLYRRRWPRRPCARGGRRRRWPAMRKAGTSRSWSGRTTALSRCRRRPAAVDISEMVGPRFYINLFDTLLCSVLV